MKLTNKTLGLTALAVLASASQALAVTFSGSTSGVFDNALGDAGLVTTGEGTSNFTWGDNDASIGVPPPPNSLSFAANTFNDIACDETFDVGTVTYYNGTTLLGTNATSVELLVDVAFTLPNVGLVPFTYVLTLNTTPNIPGPVNDFISLPDIPSQAFSLGGIQYILTLSFSGKPVFSVPENSSATSALTGMIACVPESGSSLALLGGGMLLVSGVRRKLKAKN